MAKTRKPKEWYCDVYKTYYEYCLGWKEKQYEKYIKEKYEDDFKIEGSFKGLHTFYDGYGKFVSVIWIKDKNDLQSLVHECVHSAIRTLDNCGVVLDVNNQEPITYLVDSIFKNAIKGMKIFEKRN